MLPTRARRSEMPRSNPYYRGPVTDHFDGLRFFNPGEPDTTAGRATCSVGAVRYPITPGRDASRFTRWSLSYAWTR